MAAQLTRTDVEERLAALRSTLQVDGYDLEVGDVSPGAVSLSVVAGPDACDDCLVPKAAMADLFRHAILGDTDEDLEVRLQYPND